MVKSFSSSSRDHSVFLMDGSSHSFHRALHCLLVFLDSRELTRAHWLSPYFEMAALRTSSSTFDHCPTLVTTMMPRCLRNERRLAKCAGHAGDRGARAVTPYGVVRAEVVVRATEGFTPGLRGEGRAVAPVYSLVVATEPLDDATWDRIGKNSLNSCCS